MIAAVISHGFLEKVKPQELKWTDDTSLNWKFLFSRRSISISPCGIIVHVCYSRFCHAATLLVQVRTLSSLLYLFSLLNLSMQWAARCLNAAVLCPAKELNLKLNIYIHCGAATREMVFWDVPLKHSASSWSATTTNGKLKTYVTKHLSRVAAPRCMHFVRNRIFPSCKSLLDATSKSSLRRPAHAERLTYAEVVCHAKLELRKGTEPNWGKTHKDP